MGKRYGQRPSTLIPQGIVEPGYEALTFDFNVMLLGMAAEVRAQDAAVNKYQPNGFTATRQDAFALARRARAIADGTDG